MNAEESRPASGYGFPETAQQIESLSEITTGSMFVSEYFDTTFFRARGATMPFPSVFASPSRRDLLGYGLAASSVAILPHQILADQTEPGQLEFMLRATREAAPTGVARFEVLALWPAFSPHSVRRLQLFAPGRPKPQIARFEIGPGERRFEREGLFPCPDAASLVAVATLTDGSHLLRRALVRSGSATEADA